MSNFKEMMARSALKKISRIVLALDLTIVDREKLLRKAEEVLRAVSPHICALKLNRQVTLPLGLYEGTKVLVDLAHELRLPAIMDCKVNDVGHTNRAIVEHYFNAGFDAVIASPFVGWLEGMQPVFEVARQMGRGVILLVYMSHKGAEEGFNQDVIDPVKGIKRKQYEVFAEKAVAWKADGAVVGAPYPEKIREVHGILRDEVPIYAPGLVAQGGVVEEVLKAGASYLIIGRGIYASDDPVNAAERFKEAQYTL